MTLTDPRLLRQTVISYIKQIEEIDRMLKQTSQQHRSATNIRKRTSELETQKAMIEGNIQENLELYTQAICQHFCKKVTVNLPPEIRDLVYEYIVTPDYIYAGPQYLTKPGPPCENDRGAHFWDPRYVGDFMRIELVQMWYRLSLFYFWDRQRNVEVIERFMTYDRFGLGVKPHEHLARVRFDLGDGTIHHDMDKDLSRPCIPEQYPATITEPFKKLAQFRFPNRVQFLIRIHTMGSLEYWCFSEDQFSNMLEEIIAGLTALRSAGHRFRVEWSELDNLEFTSSTSSLSYDAWNEQIRKAVATLWLKY